ncbi:laccase-1-like isoform X2 [Acanthaster planci]|uniref:Laccase-1-like isoform X2 n=1 Tax=Acanthaster planci TaxID=133434 RepID=A0A8B7YWM2_ACAPL|nr:laccase-1-like isoform X2 [Acanthaster planci]
MNPPTIFVSVVTALRPADDHPCYRQCDFTTPMICTYNWTVNWYYALSNQCGRCPNITSDCSNDQCFPADGVQRAVSLINRVFPAPSVQICSGDEVVVSVTNNLQNNEGVTIHWHGIFQNGSQFMDGLPMVTQCPIPSPGNFEYRFTPYEPGTHWFHSHTGLQRSDGLMGPFIIRESRRTDPHGDLYDLDVAENVIFLNDWHHDTSVSEFAKSQWGGGSRVDSILINGKGIAPGISPPHPPLEVFNVEQGKRYRFRVINGASSFCNMQFSVQNHTLLVIASDGGPFQPQAVEYFRINGGERMDFVLNTNQTVDNYQIQVIGLPCGNTVPSKQIAYLRYDGANDPPAINELPNITTYGNSSTWWQAFPGKSFAQVDSADADYRSTEGAEDRQEYIQVGFGSRRDPTTNQLMTYPQLNDITYYFPTSPVLSQFGDLPENIFCNQSDFPQGECAGEKLCSCVHTINVGEKERIEVILVNSDDFGVLHPMHLHGQQFEVVAMERMEGVTIPLVRELLANGSILRNNNGPRKDVIIVPDMGYTIFQFQGWNPGWWIFHCHIEFHLEMGMALLFNVHGDVPQVPAAFPTCGVWPPRADGLGSGPPDEQPCQEQLTGASALVHLGWSIPLTFLIALVIGVIIGNKTKDRGCPGSGHDNGSGGGPTPATNPAADIAI